MPKELTHWWLASEALRRLPLDRPVRQQLEEYQTNYLLGAVLPDTLLHLLSGQQGATARQLANVFHDCRTHSYAPLLRFVANSPDLPPAQQACLLGITAHIEADIVFHPFVYALAGNDMGRHYQVETDLDLWLLHHDRRPPVLELAELLDDGSREAADALMAGVFDPQDLLSADARAEALRQHTRCQARYGSPAWQLLAILLGILPGTPFHRWRHLFYPYFQWQEGRDICWPHRWRHPINGTERGDSPEGLAGEAITRITSLLRRVDDEGLSTALRRQPGENLLTGLPPD